MRPFEHPLFWELLETHKNESPSKLALNNQLPKDLNHSFFLEQVKLKQRIKLKLPNFYSKNDVVIPSQLSTEQSSSELCAQYKADNFPCESFVDATGGMGIDCLAFADGLKYVTHIELNSSLSELCEWNFEAFGANQITCLVGDGLTLSKEIKNPKDLLYLDPSRRVGDGRVYGLTEMEPNFLPDLDALMSLYPQILIKTSPMINMSEAFTSLSKHLDAIHVISVSDECKEVLYHLKRSPISNVSLIHAHHSDGTWMKYDMDWVSNPIEITGLQETGNYLHLPWPSIMKSLAYRSLSVKFDIKKLSANSHVYFSDAPIKGFPGSSYKILEQLNPKVGLKGKTAQIIIRNSAQTLDQWMKKLKLKPGSELLLLASTNSSKKAMLYSLQKVLN